MGHSSSCGRSAGAAAAGEAGRGTAAGPDIGWRASAAPSESAGAAHQQGGRPAVPVFSRGRALVPVFALGSAKVVERVGAALQAELLVEEMVFLDREMPPEAAGAGVR